MEGLNHDVTDNKIVKSQILEFVDTIRSKFEVKIIGDECLLCSDKIALLMQLSETEKHPYAWRILWILDYMSDVRPEILNPYKHAIYDRIITSNVNSTLRHLLRMILKVEIDFDNCGLLLERVITLIQADWVDIAVKVHALEFFYRVAKVEPDLQTELYLIIQDQLMLNPSTGYRNRMQRIIKQLSIKE